MSNRRLSPFDTDPAVDTRSGINAAAMLCHRKQDWRDAEFLDPGVSRAWWTVLESIRYSSFIRVSAVLFALKAVFYCNVWNKGLFIAKGTKAVSNATNDFTAEHPESSFYKKSRRWKL